jgi:hypothetical protein
MELWLTMPNAHASARRVAWIGKRQRSADGMDDRHCRPRENETALRSTRQAGGWFNAGGM